MSQNKFAIVSAVGDNSLHPTWLDGTKSFDLILIYFGDDSNVAQDYAKDADLLIRAKGQKLHMIERLVRENKLNIEGYEYVWFMDDDVLIDPAAIHEFFRLSAKYSALISQPAMVGFTSHDITNPSPKRLSLARATTFVEVMAPCFSAKALSKCLESFGEEESSYGVDYMWFGILGKPERGLLIFDAVTMEHTQPVNSIARFPNAMINMERLLNKYGIKKDRRNIGYLVRPGIWIPNNLGKFYRFCLNLNRMVSRKIPDV